MILERLMLFFIVTICFFSSPGSAIAAESQLHMKIHFIEVGQGDSILIETPSKKTILIDGGPPEAGKKVTSYLNNQKVKKIDLLIGTHPDIDHIGGLIDVIGAFQVDQVIDSGKRHSTRTYRNYIKEIKRHQIPVHHVTRDDEITVDPHLTIKVLNSYEKGKSNNQSAIALQVKYNEKQFLLMSDVEKEQEREMMKRDDLQSEFIKVAHHGSKTSSSMRFLQKVRPNVAMLTYDIENEFGHPAPTVITNLQHLDVDIYSTATYGNVVILTNGYDSLVLPKRAPLENLLQ